MKDDFDFLEGVKSHEKRVKLIVQKFHELYEEENIATVSKSKVIVKRGKFLVVLRIEYHDYCREIKGIREKNNQYQTWKSFSMNQVGYSFRTIQRYYRLGRYYNINDPEILFTLSTKTLEDLAMLRRYNTPMETLAENNFDIEKYPLTPVGIRQFQNDIQMLIKEIKNSKPKPESIVDWNKSLKQVDSKLGNLLSGNIQAEEISVELANAIFEKAKKLKDFVEARE